MAKLLSWLPQTVFFGRVFRALSGTRRSPIHSNISKDETVVFFRSAGWLNREAQEWNIPIRGWVYKPQDSVARLRVFRRVLQARYRLHTNDETEDNFRTRLNLLIADNKRGKRIVVSIAGRTVVLPATEPNGHFATIVQIPVEQVRASGGDSLLPFSMVTSKTDTREFGGDVSLIQPKGLSVISDIDDTVKVSQVKNRRSLLEKTFLHDFAATPGMAEAYRRWASNGAAFHFVSSSPWQLYSPLVEFLDTADFPEATLDLKLVRFRDETLFDLFKKGTETKPPIIRSILDRYPERQFILVGDSGEQDPEVYAGLIRLYPKQIRYIFIRNVTDEAPENKRFTALFDGIDRRRWKLFDDPALLGNAVYEREDALENAKSRVLRM